MESRYFRLVKFCRLMLNGFRLLVKEIQIDKIEDDEYESCRKEPNRCNAGSNPEERDALEKSEKQRRVAYRSQCASDVPDKKNKKHDMIPLNAVPVHSQEGTDQNHRSSCRSQYIGKHSSGCKQSNIARRGCFSGNLHMNAARYHK